MIAKILPGKTGMAVAYISSDTSEHASGRWQPIIPAPIFGWEVLSAEARPDSRHYSHHNSCMMALPGSIGVPGEDRLRSAFKKFHGGMGTLPRHERTLGDVRRTAGGVA